MKWYKEISVGGWYLVSGLLMGSAFLHGALWWLSVPGLMLLLWCVQNTRNTRSVFWYSWVAGTAKMLVVTSFVWSAHPLTWIGITSVPVQIGVLSAYWVLMSGATGLGLAVAFFLYKVYAPTTHGYTVLLFPAAILLGEALGSLFYALLMLGPAHDIVPWFSFGYIGYVLVDHDILKWAARFGGVYALGALLAFLSALALLTFVQKIFSFHSRQVLFTIYALLLLCGFLSATPSQENVSTKQVAVLTTGFNSELLNSRDPFVHAAKQELLLEAVKRTLQHDVSAIILPESAQFTGTFFGEEELFSLFRLAEANDVILIDSIRSVVDEKEVSRIAIYDSKTEEKYVYDKQHLVAFGEYMPYIGGAILGVATPSNKTETLLENLSLSPGIKREAVALPEHVPSVIFCSESALPWAVKKTVDARQGQTYVAYMASHAWLHHDRPPRLAWRHLDMMLKTQALWAGVAIIESANMAPSLHYKKDGTLGELTPIYQNSHVRVDLVHI